MSKRQQPKNYVKYSAIGFQLIIVTVALILAGKWLDFYFKLDSAFLLVSIFVAVFMVMYLLIKKLK